MDEDERAELFDQLRSMLKEYEGRLRPKHDEEGNYDLWSFKDVEIAGRKRREVFFAQAVIRKGYVGLYYMPIYTDTDLAEVFGPELLSTQRGKSCFHVRSLEGPMREQVEEALRVGYALYEERGWA